jgi:hypothetical protein
MPKPAMRTEKIPDTVGREPVGLAR